MIAAPAEGSENFMLHPPRSNPSLVSSWALPCPCITPSRETCALAMIFLMFRLLFLCSSGGPVPSLLKAFNEDKSLEKLNKFSEHFARNCQSQPHQTEELATAGNEGIQEGPGDQQRPGRPGQPCQRYVDALKQPAERSASERYQWQSHVSRSHPRKDHADAKYQCRAWQKRFCPRRRK